MTKFYFHSDDIGLSKSITDNIIDTIENGVVSSVSLIANGYDSDRAKLYLNKNKINKFVHINLTEGTALSSNADVHATLTDKNNFLRNSFFSLEFKWLFSNKCERKKIENAIYIEIYDQISKVFDTENESVSLDGHQHIHMSPLVFKSIIKVSEEIKIERIRLSNEIFLLKGYFFFKRYFYINIIKFIILKFLSYIYRPILKKNNIFHDDYCFGIMHSGNITKKLICFLKNKTLDEDVTIQIILHPGYANNNEYRFWADKKYWKFYNDNKRLSELEMAKDKSLLY